MGEFRDHRLIIPGSIFLLFFCLTWAVSDPSTVVRILTSSAPEAPSSSPNTAGLGHIGLALVALLVTGYSIGFLSSSILVAWLGFPLQRDGRDVGSLKSALGLEDRPDVKNNQIANEMSLRLHSHAPDELCQFLARRLTTMYTSYASAISIWLGYLGAIVARFYFTGNTPTGGDGFSGVLVLLYVLIFLTVLFCTNGNRAKKEHWECVCKFIEWDCKTNRYSPLDQ